MTNTEILYLSAGMMIGCYGPPALIWLICAPLRYRRAADDLLNEPLDDPTEP